MAKNKRKGSGKGSLGKSEKPKDKNSGQGDVTVSDVALISDGHPVQNGVTSNQDTVFLSREDDISSDHGATPSAQTANPDEQNTTASQETTLAEQEASKSVSYSELLSQALAQPVLEKMPFETSAENTDYTQRQDAEIQATMKEIYRAQHNEAQAIKEARRLKFELQQLRLADVERQKRLEGRRSKVREPKLDPNTPDRIPQREMKKFLYSGSPDRVREIRVKMALVQAQLAIRDDEPEKAVKYAQGAEELAKKLDYEPLCQRCKYWQARGTMRTLQLEFASPVDNVTRADIFSLKNLIDESSFCHEQYLEGGDARAYLDTLSTDERYAAKQFVRDIRAMIARSAASILACLPNEVRRDSGA